LVLVDPGELVDGRVVLRESDRRVHHLRTVLKVQLGSEVRAGVVGGPVGTGEVIENGDQLVLLLSLGDRVPAPLPIELVLALPRPKVLTRVIEAAASFGVARIALTNAWRVDKSYLDSPRLDPEVLAHAARLGAEQGATTCVPPISVHPRLMPLLDERWPVPGPGQRLIAHPGARPIEQVVTTSMQTMPITLAIGPEGGWLPREVDTFVERGFVPVSLGQPILRVETAVAAALAQLLLIERLR
jgi:RsmE family RNA methyltransferase